MNMANLQTRGRIYSAGIILVCIYSQLVVRLLITNQVLANVMYLYLYSVFLVLFTSTNPYWIKALWRKNKQSRGSQIGVEPKPLHFFLQHMVTWAVTFLTIHCFILYTAIHYCHVTQLTSSVLSSSHLWPI